MVETGTADEYRKELAALRKVMASPYRSASADGYSYESWSMQQLERRERWLVGKIRELEGTPQRRLIRVNATKGLS